MARIIKPKLHQLYGTYPKLNRTQLEYLKILTDPELKLRKLNEEEIAEIMGAHKKTLYNYRQDPNFREAVNKETMLKAADDLPDMIKDLKDMALGKGRYKQITSSAQIQAKKLWLSVMGLIEEGRQKHIETRKQVRKSFEQRLMEIDKQYKRNNLEAEE